MTVRSGARYLVVGGGIAGVATAWWLTRGGARSVVVLERESALGTSSSGKNAAVMRTGVEPELLHELATRTGQFLSDPPAGFASEPLLDRCGLLIYAAGNGSDAPAWAARSVETGSATEVSLAAAREMAPHFVPRGRRAWFFPGDGRINIDHLVAAFAKGAQDAGATLRTGAHVTRLATRGDAVCGVELADGSTLEADHVVLAAGGWAGRLGAHIGSRVELTVTQRHLLVTVPDEGVDPRWPVVWDELAEFYARPEEGGLLLCACDRDDVDPDDEIVDAAVLLAIAAERMACLPDFARARTARFWSGLRTFTPDGLPRIGADPDISGLSWIAGLAGHGMSTSAECGRIAAGLLLGTLDEPDLERALSFP